MTCVTARWPSPAGAAAAPAVAAVAHQPRLDPPRHGPAAHQRQVTPLDRVRAELPAQVRLGLRRQREDDQAARLLVDAVDGPQRGGFPAGPRQQRRQQVGQRRRQEAPARAPNSAASSAWRIVVRPGGLSTTTILGVGVADDRPGLVASLLVRPGRGPGASLRSASTVWPGATAGRGPGRRPRTEPHPA